MRVETKEAAEEAYNKMMNDVHPGQPYYFGWHSDDYDDYGDEYTMMAPVISITETPMSERMTCRQR